MRTKEQHMMNMVEHLLRTYTFKLGEVLDANRRCVHHINATQLEQLLRAYQDILVHQYGVEESKKYMKQVLDYQV